MLVIETIKVATQVSDLPRKVTDARIKAGLSIQALANQIGYSRQHLSRLENGKLDSVDIELIKKIEQAVGERIM